MHTELNFLMSLSANQCDRMDRLVLRYRRLWLVDLRTTLLKTRFVVLFFEKKKISVSGSSFGFGKSSA